MSAVRITRRRALLLGAAAGAGSVLPFQPPAWADGSGVRSFGMPVADTAFAPDGLTAVLGAPAGFDLLGARGPGVLAAGLEVRARAVGGHWSVWLPLAAGHAPDAGRATGVTDPVWTGAARELQLRTHRSPGDLRLVFIAVPAPGVVTRAAAHPRARARARAAQDGAPTIVPREQWGAAAVPPRAAPAFGEVQLAFVHHTVTANGYGPDESGRIVLGIAKYHRDSNGWNDIGYNFLVDRYGQVFEGRAGGIENAVIGAQAQGWNTQSTGIATLGTFEAEGFPEAGMAALSQLIAWKLSLHGVPTQGTVEVVSGGGGSNRYRKGATVTFQRISGHRDGCSTACPGSALYGQLAALRRRTTTVAAPLVGEPKLTLATAAATVAYGQEAVLSGRLVDGSGQPLTGVAVQVQKRGATAFTTVARAVTGLDGAWTARIAWRRGGTMRARASVFGAQETTISATVTVALVPLLEVTAPAVQSRVLAGRRAVLRGLARPSTGVRVLVERRVGGTWQRDGAQVRGAVSAGRFRVPVPLGTPGLYRLTVLTGPAAAPSAAAPVFVRAVRSRASLTSATDGGAGRPSASSGGGAQAS